MKHSIPLWKNPRARTFAIRFLGIFFLFQFIAVAGLFNWFQEMLAQFLGNWYAIPVRGTLLLLTPTPFEISALCTGITSVGIWIGLLWGFKLPLREEKIALAVWGSMLILIANIIRVMLIVYFGINLYLREVEVIHIASWFVMSALILYAWYHFMCQRYGYSNGKEMAKELLH